ncbi:MAG: hypothetical protein ABFD92_12150 [Planctomycetaceae bacterium]|nr:hypothetical protein [Planctomycetaceae bacterium]
MGETPMPHGESMGETPMPRGVMMQHRVIVIGLVLAAAVQAAPAGDQLPPGCKEWKDTDFVHPPLKVMEPYKRIDEYPVVAWCFHGQGAKRVPYDETYARNAKAAGFNMLIDGASMLEPCRKVGGLKVVVPAFHHGPDRLKAGIFGPHGDHPCLVGIVTDDNNPRIYPNVIENAKWITQTYPHIMPWDSENPDPRTQSKTTMRVLGTQNYPFMRGSRNPVGDYCFNCWVDRDWGVKADMSVWEIYSGANAFNQQSFQMLAGLAYGSQGLVNFAYTPHRDTPYHGKMYQPDSPLIPQFKKLHDYIRLVVGRHLWGTRCINVIHSIHGGDHSKERWKIQAPTFAADQLVVRGSEWMMVGLLTPEKRFLAKDTEVPEYFLVIDKRTSGGGAPERRAAYVMFSDRTPVFEMLDETAVKDAPIRKLVPGWKFRMNSQGGEGVLLRVAPDLEQLLGGKKGLALYAAINKTMGQLQWKVSPPCPAGQKIEEDKLTHVAIEGKVIDAAVAQARKDRDALAKLLDAAVSAGKLTKAQTDDTLKRLDESIAATAAQAKTPPAP